MLAVQSVSGICVRLVDAICVRPLAPWDGGGQLGCWSRIGSVFCNAVKEFASICHMMHFLVSHMSVTEVS